MAITVTRTKIIVPRRRNDILTRKRLNRLLDDLLDYKLLLIAAPAGYGKTSLLVDWVYQNDLPVCWYALDHLDQDLPRFISHLVASISQIFPGFGGQSRAALENYTGPNQDIGRIITAIVNDAYENIKEHFAIVLDDFHAVDASDEVNEFVNRFVTEVDENCHLVIASRTLLALPDLPLMVGRSMVKGLSYDELAFQADEIQALLQLNYKQTISGEVAAELQQETEGWITGLLLSAQTIWEGMTDRVRVARASGIGLYEYLVQQVLEQQSPVVRDFLLRTSLLEEFNDELCQVVLGDAPPGYQWFGLIREVLQNNLFVLPVDDRGTWLRYHHLFCDFLQEKYWRDNPQLVKEILQRLAKVYLEQDAWEKAYEIYQRIGDEAGIVHLIERAGVAMLKNRQLEVLNRWLSRLKPEDVRKRPSLLSILGAINILYGNVELGISRLDQAENQFDAQTNRQQLALLLMRRSTGHGFLGNYQEALVDVDKALALVDGVPEMQDIYADSLRLKGLGFYRLGNLGEAIQYMEKALIVFRSLSNPQNEALTHGDLGLAYMDAGQLPEALRHCEQALAFWTQSGNIARKVTVLNNIGVLHYLLGKYDQASKYLDESLILARKSGNLRIEAYALAGIGDLYAELDALNSASEAYRLGREITTRINNQRLLIYTYLADASVNRKRGNLAVSDRLMGDVERLIRKSDSTYEIGLHNLISGQILMAKGEFTQALPPLEKAIQSFKEGGQDKDSIQAYLSLAWANYNLGNLEQGYKLLDDAIQLGLKTNGLHALITAGREVENLLLDPSMPPYLRPQVNQLIKQVKAYKKRIPEFRRILRQQKLVIAIEQAPRLTIQALGTAQVSLAGDPIATPEWRTQNSVRELFYLLLAHPDGLSKDDIGLILWPESSQQQLKVQFKNALYRLRRALGKDVVIFEQNEDSYRFNRGLDYEYDVEVFHMHIKRAKNASGASQINAYQAAVKVYQGAYQPEGEGFWIELERERLWQDYLQAELAVVTYNLENADFHAALAHIHRILAQDPCQEEAHRLAMRVYAAMGNHAGLVRQFEVCKDTLQKILGISPSPQTESLFLELLTDK